MKQLCVAIMISLSIPCLANETKQADWKTKAKVKGLDMSAIAHLERDGILVTDEAFKQIAYAFDNEIDTIFITSDALLNAYHVLFEQTIALLEENNTERLIEELPLVSREVETAGENIKGDPQLLEAARTRARLVLGVAARLLSPDFRFNDPELDQIIADMVARVERGAGTTSLPKWLGPPSDDFLSLDLSQYKPRGFYAKSDYFSRYFRALSWLHSIPFRLQQDEELIAMALLSQTSLTIKDGGKVRGSSLNWFIGRPDNPDATYNAIPSRIELTKAGLQKVRNKALEDEHWGEISDTEPSYRVLSAYALPSALLFEKTMAATFDQRDLPNGLEIAAALGSTLASNHLARAEGQNLAAIIDSMKNDFTRGYYLRKPNRLRPRNGADVLSRQSRALQTLLARPPPDAPEFMRGEAWKTKSLNTVLASWAQKRHATVLQAKASEMPVCSTEDPPGFIEPNPEFFERMAALAFAIQLKLQEMDELKPTHKHLAEKLRDFIVFAESFKSNEELTNAYFALPLPKKERFSLGFELSSWRDAEGYVVSIEWVEQVADDIAAGKIDRHPDVRFFLDLPATSLNRRWTDLGFICQRLETLAHKQLRQIPMSEDDAGFMRSFCKVLSATMFWESNVYYDPRDDAPRIADVYSNNRSEKYLHVGISRPRKIYVLYPWEGREILCEGAITPYYEFAHPTRLNDAEWKTMLDSKQRPAIPVWLKPIVEDGELAVPVLRDD